MQTYKHIRKRRIISTLLLVLYVLCLTVTITHRHEYAGHHHTVCADCENHVQHHGHIGTLEKVHDDCVLCQTLTMPVVFVPLTAILFRQTHLASSHCVYISRLASPFSTSQPLRGPPMIQ